MRVLAAVALIGALGPGSAWAAVEVLTPRPSAHTPADGVWLVVRAPEAPEVLLDGARVAVGASGRGVHHYRLPPLEHDRGAVELGGTTLTLGGGSSGFHGGETAPCWECHDAGDRGCLECHPQPQGSKHRPVLAEGCVRCHGGTDRSAGVVQELCLGCHPKYGEGRHGRLRHAVASENDPLRPGQAMDCASCHDPHAPRCLSCIPRTELRSWCKRCHGGP